ncbi:MAG TPA: DUF1257 domain-containing protein [Methanocella sp.]|nr:DUF1257 domain-containing protein [Methanocella sp.]
MSHFTMLTTKIRDTEVLTRSLAEMGYGIRTDTNIINIDGESVPVDYAICALQGVDVGFKKNPGGYYDIMLGWLDDDGEEAANMIIDELTAKINKIQQEYAVNMVIEQTYKQGFRVAEKAEQSDGSIRIVVRRWT